MPTPTFNIGKDGQAVFVGPFGQVTFNYTKFRWSDKTKQIISRPLNSPTQLAEVPDYYEGSFDIDRNSNVVETLLSQRDQQFWDLNQAIPYATLYFYIMEINSSLTTVAFANVTFKASQGGEYQQEDAVKQTVEFCANRMRVQ